ALPVEDLCIRSTLNGQKAYEMSETRKAGHNIHARLLLSFLLVTTVSACGNEQYDPVKADCTAVKNYYKLSDEQYEKCRSNAEIRRRLVVKRAKNLSEQLA